jgi:ADP-ribose pyrophosphatase YjhB (NUDIX family)
MTENEIWAKAVAELYKRHGNVLSARSIDEFASYVAALATPSVASPQEPCPYKLMHVAGFRCPNCGVIEPHEPAPVASPQRFDELQDLVAAIQDCACKFLEGTTKDERSIALTTLGAHALVLREDFLTAAPVASPQAEMSQQEEISWSAFCAEKAAKCFDTLQADGMLTDREYFTGYIGGIIEDGFNIWKAKRAAPIEVLSAEGGAILKDLQIPSPSQQVSGEHRADSKQTSAAPVGEPGRTPHRYSMTAIFSDDFSRLLLLRKPDTHPNPLFRGKWTFPGGLVENGESVQKSAERELFEETQLTASVRPILRFFCDCDPTEAEHEIFLYAGTLPIDAMNGAVGSSIEPVQVFADLPVDLMWYLPQLRDLAIMRLRQPAAPPAQGAPTPRLPVSEVQNILMEVCQILGVKLGPGLATYAPLIARVRALAAQGAPGTRETLTIDQVRACLARAANKNWNVGLAVNAEALTKLLNALAQPGAPTKEG